MFDIFSEGMEDSWPDEITPERHARKQTQELNTLTRPRISIKKFTPVGSARKVNYQKEVQKLEKKIQNRSNPADKSLL